MGVNNKQITTNTALMFEPVRGGTRGGQAEFSWSDVSQDKDREVSMIVMIAHLVFIVLHSII
jgi:hypothetical protein